MPRRLPSSRSHGLRIPTHNDQADMDSHHRLHAPGRPGAWAQKGRGCGFSANAVHTGARCQSVRCVQNAGAEQTATRRLASRDGPREPPDPCALRAWDAPRDVLRRGVGRHGRRLRDDPKPSTPGLGQSLTKPGNTTTGLRREPRLRPHNRPLRDWRAEARAPGTSDAA